MRNKKTIRILILTDGMPAGGTERQIIELLRGLGESYPQIKTIFGTLAKGGAREQEAYRFADEVLPVKQYHQFDITLGLSLIKFVKKYHIDIIHSFGSIADLSGVVAAKVTGVRLVNGSIRNARRSLTMRDRLSKFSMGFADQIVANSKAGIVAYGVSGNKNVRVIYNGVNFERFVKIQPVKHCRPYICMVGNFTRKKDQKALVNAFPMILTLFPQYNLLFVGKGKTEQEIRRLARKLEIHEKVLIVNNCDAPEPYIKGADICVLLSTDGEGLSNVIIEYCALSRPVIASNLGGNKEIVSHCESGILIESHSRKEVSNAIIDLLANKEKAAKFGSVGRKIAVSTFSLERMIAEYSSLYSELAATQKIN